MKTKTTLCLITLSLLMMSFAHYKMVTNGFNLENTKYATTFAYHQNFGADQTRLSGNIDIHLSSKPKESLNDTYNYVLLDLNSPDLNALSEGVYTYEEPQGKTRSPYTFSDAYAIVNFDPSKKGDFHQAIGGQIEVIRKGSKYKITYNLWLEDGLAISGFYAGLVKKW